MGEEVSCQKRGRGEGKQGKAFVVCEGASVCISVPWTLRKVSFSYLQRLLTKVNSAEC